MSNIQALHRHWSFCQALACGDSLSSSSHIQENLPAIRPHPPGPLFVLVFTDVWQEPSECLMPWRGQWLFIKWVKEQNEFR